MKKIPTLVTALALATLPGGCKKKDCLTESYDATVQLVQEFNEQRCHTVFNGDRRTFECPGGHLEGEVNGRKFELAMVAPGVHYEFNRERLQAKCGASHAESTDMRVLGEIEGRFKEALAQLEVD